VTIIPIIIAIENKHQAKIPVMTLIPVSEPTFPG